MKKIIMCAVCAVLVSAHCFAEFVLMPAAGFSNFALDGKAFDSSGSSQVDVKTALSSFNLSLALGSVSGAGFTFLWDNNLALGGKLKSEIKKTSDSFSEEMKGVFYEGNLLFGYTFKGIKNLYINAAAGLGSGFGLLTPKKAEYKIGMLSAGIPIQLGAQYFFTKNIGVNVSFLDVPSFGIIMTPFDIEGLVKELTSSRISSAAASYGIPLAPSPSRTQFQAGFTNVFTLKIGPVFKF